MPNGAMLARCARLLALVAGLLVVNAAGTHTQVGVREGAAHRLLVVFKAEPGPSDAESVIQEAGGYVAAELGDIGVVIAEAPFGGGSELRRRLRAHPAVLDVGSDWVVGMEPQSHWPHALPTFSASLPPDFLYSSTPQQWAAKRIGAAGGGVATQLEDPASGAWDVTFGRGVKVAVIDSGVNPLHPDIDGKVVFSRALSHPTPLLGDVNCEVPDSSNPFFDSPIDQVGHGSWVASLAAGALGGGLLVGAAPEADVISIKILRRVAASSDQLAAVGIPATAYFRCLHGGSQGLGSWLLQALVLASAEGADVISMSLGGLFPRNAAQTVEPAAFRALHRAVSHATARGALLVAAAINLGRDLDGIGPHLVIPAELPNVIAVVATTNPNCMETAAPFSACTPGPETLASYSNHGARLQALAAPGGAFPVGFCGFNGVPCFETGMVVGACAVGIPGTSPPIPDTFPVAGPPPEGTSFGCFSFPYPPLTSVPTPGRDQHMWYVPNMGTSAATPLVAGAAALVKAARPELSPAQIRSILQATAQDLGKRGYDDMFNFGLVDAAAAVRAAAR